MSREDKVKRLKQSALKFTAYRERAPKEVVDKLAEWDARPEEIEKIIKELEAENFIDEERFARAFCHDKFLINKWGKRRIAMEIRKYDLSSSALDQGLNYIDSVKYEKVLNELAHQKWNKLKDPELIKRKQKTVNYLIQKGYEQDLIWNVVNELKIK